MDKYYYFVSQLPALVFGKSSYMDMGLFVEEAEKWLPAKDMTKLVTVNISNYETEKNDPLVVRKFKYFEKEFRTDLAQWREAQKKSREYKPSLFNVSVVREGNPLEKEENLLKLRWQFITDLEEGHNFDLDFLLLYYMKLQIQNRLAMFEPEKGMEQFQKLCKVSV
ncbi:DUF2764 family protein [bacterium]|nr:DUF2764 family protein [bacterium]